MVCIVFVTMVTMIAMYQINHSDLIDKLGGTGTVAGMCDVTSQAVSKWRRTGIPDSWLKYLRLLKPIAFEQDVGVGGQSTQLECEKTCDNCLHADVCDRRATEDRRQSKQFSRADRREGGA